MVLGLDLVEVATREVKGFGDAVLRTEENVDIWSNEQRYMDAAHVEA